jgi:beta-lactamase superfamily II metal-dependent hydrolase
MRKWAIGILVAGIGLAPASGWAAQTDPAAPPAAAAVQPTPSDSPAAPAPLAAGPPPAGTYVIHAIDVGTGLAVFVRGQDFALLYDTGSNDDGARGANNRVLAYLRAVAPDLTVIDHLILSHPHEDHDAMIDDILATFQVRNVWDSGSFNNACAYHAFLDAVAAEPGVVYHDALGSGGTHDATFTASSRACHGAVRTATVQVPRGSQIAPGVAIPLGAGAQMTILHANGNARSDHLNDASVVARLDLGSRRVLLPGDAEAGGQRSPPTVPPTPDSVEGKLLICCTPDLRSDLLVAAHHGSKTSSRNTFLDAVDASHFVISSGPKKYSGTQLPSQEVVDEMTRRAALKGGALWRTDVDDEACKTKPAKIGPDNDRKPGGCDNIRIVIGPTGEMAVDNSPMSD